MNDKRKQYQDYVSERTRDYLTKEANAIVSRIDLLTDTTDKDIVALNVSKSPCIAFGIAKDRLQARHSSNWTYAGGRDKVTGEWYIYAERKQKSLI